MFEINRISLLTIRIVNVWFRAQRPAAFAKAMVDRPADVGATMPREARKALFFRCSLTFERASPTRMSAGSARNRQFR